MIGRTVAFLFALDMVLFWLGFIYYEDYRILVYLQVLVSTITISTLFFWVARLRNKVDKKER